MEFQKLSRLPVGDFAMRPECHFPTVNPMVHINNDGHTKGIESPNNGTGYILNVHAVPL